MSDILKIKDLVIQYDTDSGCVHALNGLSLTLREGETLGLVGETGAGKTTLARSIMGLIQCPPGKIVSGKILYRGEDLLTMKEARSSASTPKSVRRLTRRYPTEYIAFFADNIPSGMPKSNAMSILLKARRIVLGKRERIWSETLSFVL